MTAITGAIRDFLRLEAAGGVLLFAAAMLAMLCAKSPLARLPAEVSWMPMLGAALLCGTGFTMSLFIATLAFEGEGVRFAVDSQLGILAGSIASGVAGFLVLWFAPRRQTGGPS